MSATEWANFFDHHAPVYDDNCFTRNTLREVDFLVEELALAPGRAVLDVGCGTGRHAVELARRGCRVTGIDLSHGMLEQARRRAESAAVAVDFRQGDATQFSVEQSFDAVICLCEGAFGLLGRGDDAIGQPLAILQRVAAALKLEGRCLFTVLNACAMIRRHTPADAANGVFDPHTLTEVSDCQPPGSDADPIKLRERGFVPTELMLLFSAAGLDVEHIWGGTAGNWGRRPLELDEMEIMVVAHRSHCR